MKKTYNLHWAISRIGVLKDLVSLHESPDRGRDRLRRASLSGITSFLSQGIGIGTNLISIPLTINYLGGERYGVWLTMSSLLGWMAISDIGLGNALVNALAEAHGKDDRLLAREFVATSFWVLMAIAFLLTLIFTLMFRFVPWATVFNVSTDVPQQELQWAVIFSMASFVFLFPISIVSGIYRGYQEEYLGNMWGIAGSILSLAALLVVTRIQGGLPLLVLALSGTRILVTLANAGYLFTRQYPWLNLGFRSATRRSLHRLMPLGIKYLVQQLAGIGMFQSQPLIITQLLGPAQVGIFHVAHRLLTLPLLVVQRFTLPLVPAYGEALARQDWAWIRRTFWHSLLGSAIVSISPIIVLAFLARPIINMWVGPTMIPGGALVAGLAVYAVVNAIVAPMACLLSGLERVGGQAIIAVVNALFTVSLCIFLIKIWGLPGMALAMALGFIVVNLVGQMIHIYLVIKTTRPILR